MKTTKLGAWALLCVLALGTMTMTGCDAQQTAAELVATLGTATASLETIEGNTAASAQVATDTQAAEQAILNWKSGTSTQDISEALTIVENDLNLLPVSATDTALVDLAIGTVEDLLALFPSTGQGTVAAANAVVVRPTVAERAIPAVKVKDAADFKKQWNALVKAQPKLAGAAIK